MHKLAARAARLSRQVYASLPWRYRLAQLLLKLAVEPQEAHGNFFYGVFVKAGVQEMPDIGKTPAKDFPGRDNKIEVLVNAIRRVDSRYGHKFGGRVWGVACSRFGYRITEEAISWMVEKLTRKPDIIKGKYALNQAESYVVDGVLKRCKDMVKRHWRKKEKSLTVDVGEQPTQRVVADPSALNEMVSKIPKWEIKRMMSRLRSVDRKHPERAPQYIEMVLNDMTDTAMSKEWDMSIKAVGLWKRRNRTKLWDILKDYLPGAAA